jgi:tRNA(fMet)-specific endonuclease VapC
LKTLPANEQDAIAACLFSPIGQSPLANESAELLIGFETAAASTFQSIKKTYPRLGSMDLKIAAIAIANNATLLTRNLSDFSQIKNLRTEQWTVSL